MSDNPLFGSDWERLDLVQQEITRWADEQFPGRTDHQTIYKLVVHEIPELMTHKKEKGTAGIGTELADCFILLMDLASMWGVDLTEAIRDKMETNYQRTWERDAHGIMQHVKTPLYNCTNPNMTSEAKRFLLQVDSGRCRYYPDCYCGTELKPPAEPARVDLVYCPYCRSCSHTIPVTPDTPVPAKGSHPNDTHICTKCEIGFDDSIPF